MCKTKIKNFDNAQKLNVVKTLKLKLWQNSKAKNGSNRKTQIVTKLKNSNCDKT